MQVTMETLRMCEQCVPGTPSSEHLGTRLTREKMRNKKRLDTHKIEPLQVK